MLKQDRYNAGQMYFLRPLYFPEFHRKKNYKQENLFHSKMSFFNLLHIIWACLLIRNEKNYSTKIIIHNAKNL